MIFGFPKQQRSEGNHSVDGSQIKKRHRSSSRRTWCSSPQTLPTIRGRTHNPDHGLDFDPACSMYFFIDIHHKPSCPDRSSETFRPEIVTFPQPFTQCHRQVRSVDLSGLDRQRILRSTVGLRKVRFVVQPQFWVKFFRSTDRKTPIRIARASSAPTRF